jgi:PilX N-terminal
VQPRGGVTTALAIGLVLLAVLSVLSISSLTLAAMEQRMAANDHDQERAFRAAEAGIEQALAAGDFPTDPAAGAGAYTSTAGTDPVPIRGRGVPIAGCPRPLAAAAGPCEYFLRHDHATGPTPVPGADPSTGADQRAWHFVIDAYGVAGRGAESHQVQGFYRVAAAGGEPAGPVVRSFWRTQGLD